MSQAELADLLEQDRRAGRSIARTLAMAEAQTLDIPPREERSENAWIGFAMMLDGYRIAEELLGRDVRQWFAEITSGDGHPPLEFWRPFSVMELRLLLFTYQRADYWYGHQTDAQFEIPANDILDVLREKLEAVK